MLALSVALAFVPTPVVAIKQLWLTFAAHPIDTLLDVVLLRQQPFLSAVLPMYVLFASGVPFTVPLARRSPAIALLFSLGTWFMAPWLGTKLPSATGEGWPFNPFAWQLMFMLGVLCRLHPISRRAQASYRGRQITSIAIAIALTMAFVKLCIDVHPSPGYIKQNLSGVRILSFLSIAWLCGQAVRLGWIRWLSERLSPVVTLGRQGLVCFVGGTVVSTLADAGLHLATGTSHSAMDWPVRLTGDVAEIAALLIMASVVAGTKRAGRTQTSERDFPSCMNHESAT
jgi:hypothetical protein